MLAPDQAVPRMARPGLWLRAGGLAASALVLVTGLVMAASLTAPHHGSAGSEAFAAGAPVASFAALAGSTMPDDTDAPPPDQTLDPSLGESSPDAGQVQPANDPALPGATTKPPADPIVTPAPGPTLDPTANPTTAPTAAPTVAPTPKPTPNPTPTPAPPSGVHLTLGAWAGQPWNVSSLKSFASLVGGTPGMYLTYLSWPDRAQYVASDEKAIANLGASHVMTWEPFGMTLKSIANGSHNSYIRQYAQGAAAYGKRFYIRLMHEMNGDWYPWGRGVGGNTSADFVNAWRHVVDIFDNEGATNVKWVWCPNVRYGKEYPFADLWPGSSYVDWTCLDGYNWGTDPHLGQPAWQSFGTIFGSTYDQIMAIASSKPMLIGETASTEHGGDKAAWITKTFMTDVAKYPAIKSVVWFNQADGNSDFRVNSSQAALNAFRQVVNSSLWNGTLP